MTRGWRQYGSIRENGQIFRTDREEGKQNEELGRFIKGGDLRQKMSQGKIVFLFLSLDKETNVGNSPLNRKMSWEISIRNRVWDWTRNNSSRIKLCSTELFPFPIQIQFFLLALMLFCDTFYYHFSRGGLWLSVITCLGCQLHQQIWTFWLLPLPFFGEKKKIKFSTLDIVILRTSPILKSRGPY